MHENFLMSLTRILRLSETETEASCCWHGRAWGPLLDRCACYAQALGWASRAAMWVWGR